MSFLDLALRLKRTTGDVPPATVGSTVTVIGRKAYVIAGRIVSTRRMTCDIYALNLDTFVWTRLPIEEDAAPQARYFHTANAYGDSIVIYGGMSSKNRSDQLCVLGDVAIFDTRKLHWRVNSSSVTDNLSTPRPRYAHLSTITSRHLIVVGGQDIGNDYLEDAAIFDLQNFCWKSTHPVGKQCGAYRSLLVTANQTGRTRRPTKIDLEVQAALSGDITTTSISPISSGSSFSHAVSTRSGSAGSDTRRPSVISSLCSAQSGQKSDHAVDTPPREQSSPSPMYLYSNFNFIDVQRELHTLEWTAEGLVLQDRSTSIQGDTLPPGLRFPSGTIVGDHMIVYGTYLTNTSQAFSLWSLSLVDMTWSRIALGTSMSTGSWNKGLYCDSLESFLIFGHAERSLVDDYNHRQTNFDHLALIDLEAYGIVRPTSMALSPRVRQLGLTAMTMTALCDMELMTRERTVIPVSSRILQSKWPSLFLSSPSSSSSSPHAKQADGAPRRRRTYYVPYDHALVAAFVRFLYIRELPASFELSVPSLCAMLLFASSSSSLPLPSPSLLPNGREERDEGETFGPLMKRCREALHRLLTYETAAHIYESATLAGQKGLQVRALQRIVSHHHNSLPATSTGTARGIGSPRP